MKANTFLISPCKSFICTLYIKKSTQKISTSSTISVYLQHLDLSVYFILFLSRRSAMFGVVFCVRLCVRFRCYWCTSGGATFLSILGGSLLLLFLLSSTSQHFDKFLIKITKGAMKCILREKVCDYIINIANNI